MPYFIIHNSDGETDVEQISKEELLNRIKPYDDGESDNSKSEYYGGGIGFLSEIKESDTNYWGNNLLIIKGEIVVPKSVRVVKEYEI